MAAVGAGRQAAGAVGGGRGEILPLLAILAIGVMDRADAGYFASSWGWIAAPLLWLVALAVLGGAATRVGALELAWLVVLGGISLWTALSSEWSLAPSDSLLEAERTTVYVALAAALLVLTPRGGETLWIGALQAVLVLVVLDALLPHLLPNTIRPYDPYTWQLADPIGYSDGLGLVAASALLLAIGLAARTDPTPLRALAAASAVPAAATLYFTFSRSGWLAAAVGALAAVALDRRRLELAVSALPSVVAATVAVALCVEEPALRRRLEPLPAAAHAGHRLAIELAVLGVGVAVATALLPRPRPLLVVGRATRRAALAAAALSMLVLAGFGVHHGTGPWSLAASGVRGFEAAPRADGHDLSTRLFSVSGNLRDQYWATAGRDVAAHPFLGSGAGSFGTYWLQHRRTKTAVLDVHNLYLEALAELGPTGLALVLALIGLPFLAAWRVRDRPLAAVALAPVAAFAVHAAFQWDWELPGVTAAALVCAAALLRAARSRESAEIARIRPVLLLGVLCAAGFSSVALVGNGAVAAASRAADAGDWPRAVHEARRATSWTPWSADAWSLRGEAELELGEPSRGESSLRRALHRAPNKSSLWLEYAQTQRGRRRLDALATAARLDPLDTVAPGSGWVTYAADPGRGGFTRKGLDPTRLRLRWVVKLDGGVTAQPLVTPPVEGGGGGQIIVGTAAGTVYELDPSGRVVQRRRLGSIRLPACAYFPDRRYGITGTPVIDASSQTLYVADGRGLVHALDLHTLAERRGWPVRVLSDPAKEHVWGALTLADGRLFVATGILCRKASGHLVAIETQSRRLTTFTVVPRSRGSGGGIWGWGGPTYDVMTRSVLVLTGDALPARHAGMFDEAVGYAEHLVRLTPSLRVAAADAPVHYTRYRDSDFTGSPIVVRAPGCRPLVVGENKNGRVYSWELDRIAAGASWSRRLEGGLNGQPAWSPLTRSLYVVGHYRLYRLRLEPSCRFVLRWSIPLAGAAVNGPPLIDDGVLWFDVSSAQELWAVDALTGRILRRLDLREAAFAPPAIDGGSLYAGAFRGLLFAFSGS